MRHRKSGRKLNRNSSHRIAMFRNMSASLFKSELIKTTLAKAKELRRVAEPLITLAKVDTVSNRRLAFSRLRSKEVVAKLFNELGPRFKERPGGYLRILKCGFRQGDSAPMALVQLSDLAVDGEKKVSEKTSTAKLNKKDKIAAEQDVNTISDGANKGTVADEAVVKNAESVT